MNPHRPPESAPQLPPALIPARHRQPNPMFPNSIMYTPYGFCNVYNAIPNMSSTQPFGMGLPSFPFPFQNIPPQFIAQPINFHPFMEQSMVNLRPVLQTALPTRVSPEIPEKTSPTQPILGSKEKVLEEKAEIAPAKVEHDSGAGKLAKPWTKIGYHYSNSDLHGPSSPETKFLPRIEISTDYLKLLLHINSQMAYFETRIMDLQKLETLLVVDSRDYKYLRSLKDKTKQVHADLASAYGEIMNMHRHQKVIDYIVASIEENKFDYIF